MSEATGAILNRTLEELVAREARLEPFVDELGATRAARKELEKVIAKAKLPAAPRQRQLGTGCPPLRSGQGQARPSATGDESPRAKYRLKVIADLQENGPSTTDSIVGRIGYRGGTEWLEAIINQAVHRGEVEQDGDLWAAKN